jgi:hypothetical protein
MSLLKANRALEPRKSCKSNCMHRTTRLVIFTALAAPFVLSAPSLGIPEANADCQRDRHGLCKATGRPELEVVNRANKEVRCDLLDYDRNRKNGRYYAAHASVTVAAKKTKRNKHRFVNRAKIGAICYFTEDYPRAPALTLKNGLGPGPFHRTDHFPDAKRGKVILTVMSNLSNVTVGSTTKSSPAPRQARPGRAR